MKKVSISLISIYVIIIDKITVNLQAVNAPILDERFMKLKCRKVMMFGELNKNIKRLLVKSGNIKDSESIFCYLQ